MKELAVGTSICSDSEGQSYTMQYLLLVRELHQGDFSCEDFGVKIVSSDGNFSEIPSITPSYTRIMELITLLIKHTVTPIGLPDVVQDWL